MSQLEENGIYTTEEIQRSGLISLFDILESDKTRVYILESDKRRVYYKGNPCSRYWFKNVGNDRWKLVGKYISKILF
jgi:hypothetical protein